MLKYHEIISKDKAINDILKETSKDESISSSSESKNILIAIDFQEDFMENGSLAVPNSLKDVRNTTRFIYDNINNIHDIIASLDTHSPVQIFHPCFFADTNGKTVKPFTVITYEDIMEGKYNCLFSKEKVLKYLKIIETQGKNLTIWPYHCLLGSTGAALSRELNNMLLYYSVRKGVNIKMLQKGQFQLSEMYGIFKPEFTEENDINNEYLDYLKGFQKIIICGEAKSHCVLESLKQIINYYRNDKEILNRIYLLTDCTSSIPGFEEATEKEYLNLSKKYGINLVSSKDLIL